MRKYQQQQLLELKETLNEACSEIRRLHSLGEAQALTGLLSVCQESAVQIGNFIEALEGEGTKTVEYLQEYCDLLYEISLEAENSDKSKGFERRLQKQLIKVENSIRSELRPNRIEVAFFPYKASMWDSLESVWLAAKNDPQCDAYVVPIPYYDKSVGSGDKMYYEGGLFPDYVPVVDWKEYDVEERHPDVAFIHYPYDDHTRNASVHSDFFSPRLRQNCGLLAYVPYFVVNGETVDEFYGHLPGILHSNYVFVQSEAVRRSYIEHYRKFDREYGWRGAFGKAEEKFIALGSPKFDKVISSKREDYDLPPEWQRKLYKADGTRKKLVLYNTHMFTWINNCDEYFKKVRSVFEAFRNSEDIVLWWRPHPNTELNFRVFHPNRLSEYNAVVEDFKSDGRGIYDDTPDLHRALTWTDAYYGDWSSLVAMYCVTAKPVLIQHVHNLSDGHSGGIKLLPGDFVKDKDGNFWGYDLLLDELLQLDFQSNTAYPVARSGAMPKYLGKKQLFSHRYVGIGTTEDSVVAFPHFLNEIFIYYPANGRTEKIQLDAKYLLSQDSDGFTLRDIVEFKNKQYCFGAHARAIVVFDGAENSVRYDTALLDMAGVFASNGEFVKYPIYIGECSEKGDVTILLKDYPDLIRYNLPSQKVEVVASNNILACCRFADFDGKYFWLISNSNESLIKWDPVTNEGAQYPLAFTNFDISDLASVFSGIVDCGKYLLLFPTFGKAVLRFDKEEEKLSECEEMPVPADPNGSLFKYHRPKRLGEKIYAFARHNYTMYELDLSTDTVMPHCFHLAEDSFDRFYDNFIDFAYNDETIELSRLGVPENAWVSNPERFLFHLFQHNPSMIEGQRESALKCLKNADGKAGEAIYRYMLESLKG